MPLSKSINTSSTLLLFITHVLYTTAYRDQETLQQHTNYQRDMKATYIQTYFLLNIIFEQSSKENQLF